MPEKETEIETPKNEEEELSEETPTEEDETPETSSEEELEQLKKQAKLAENYRIRAEKAEKKLKTQPKEEKKETPKEPSEGLSSKDVIYLAKVDIHDDDIDEVLTYAKLNKKSVKEAHQYLQPILDRKAEERKSAEATNTKSPRGTSKPDASRILADAQRGKLPEADDAEGIDALVSAHLAAKQPDIKRR